MRLTRLRSTCPDSDTCPTLYRTDRGTMVVQGYVVTHMEALSVPDLAAGETAVEVPLDLLAGLITNDSAVYPTERGTMLVRGTAVTDLETLTTLRLPIGEAAVEIHLNLPADSIEQEVSA